MGAPQAREALALDLVLRGSPHQVESLTVGRISGLYEALRHDPSSITAQVAGGDGHARAEHLLYLLVDELRTANWQRSKDGQKGRNRPKPISPLAKKPGVRTGRTDRDPADVMRLLNTVGAAPTTA
ncbi:DUF5361 domain-containing protein [Streptomyces sp. E11-3]|uniref:DUF5361 domain-containing protein n=1 Tax=Streptomyces sp. E11-3 TaxID=3110112 RepID=UPI0039810F6F